MGPGLRLREGGYGMERERVNLDFSFNTKIHFNFPKFLEFILIMTYSLATSRRDLLGKGGGAWNGAQHCMFLL